MGDVLTQESIANFYCDKDNDIEAFLKERAVIFEKLGKARTFIVLDEDVLENEIKILGYFAFNDEVGNKLLVLHRILQDKEILS